MLTLYGNPLSSPSNKICYCANYLNIPYEFVTVNLGAGEQKTIKFARLLPLKKIPAIDDNGFILAESNAIVRYLANKHESSLYPKNLQERAIVDQWIDYASHHIALATSKIMFNTVFYKFSNTALDERSLQDGKFFLSQYLPVLEQQLTSNKYMAGNTLTLADICLLGALDVCEVIQYDLSAFPCLVSWRKNLMAQDFYKKCHNSYADTFNAVMAHVKQEK